MDAALLVQLLGVFGLGSIFAQALSTVGERRKYRADVLHALGRTERARWHPRPDGELSFQDLARELETAALLAGVPQSVVRTYVVVAHAASLESSDSYDEYPDQEGGSISTDHADAARSGARILAEVAWHPWLAGFSARRRAARLTKVVEGLPDFSEYLRRSRYMNP